MKIKKHILLLSIFLLITMLFSGCSSKIPQNTVFSSEDLNGKKVGVMENSTTERYLRSYTDKMSIRTCSDTKTLAQELLSGEIDAAIADEKTADEVLSQSGKLTMLEELFLNDEYCIAVSQENDTLLKNVNSVISDIYKSGELDTLINGWLYGDYEYISEGKTNGTYLTVAVCPNFYPYCFYDENGQLDGLEIDLIKLICDKLGVGVELKAVDSNKLIYSVESGKVSLSIGRIVSGDAAVLYSDSYFTSVQKILVRK